MITRFWHSTLAKKRLGSVRRGIGGDTRPPYLCKVFSTPAGDIKGTTLHWWGGMVLVPAAECVAEMTFNMMSFGHKIAKNINGTLGESTSHLPYVTPGVHT
jgi:hypothetical protein